MMKLYDHIFWDCCKQPAGGGHAGTCKYSRMRSGVDEWNVDQVLDCPPYNIRLKLIHCDPLVLHAPGACRLCDEHGYDLQVERIEKKIGFSGEECPDGFLEDPAEVNRPGVHQIWVGNQPKTLQ